MRVVLVAALLAHTAFAAVSSAPHKQTSEVSLPVVRCMMERSLASLGGCRREGGCDDLVGPMYAAMQQYSISLTLERVVSFLASVYHETDLMRVFHQPADDGAGAFHMIPSNLRYACERIPLFLREVAEAVPYCPSVDYCGDPACLADHQISALVNASIPLSFYTAAWWFPSGAFEVLGSDSCLDLNAVSDAGLGDAPYSNLPTSADCVEASGFYRVSCCIFGRLDANAGMAQRVRYYNEVQVSYQACRASGDDSTDDGGASQGPSSWSVYLAAGLSLGMFGCCVLCIVVSRSWTAPAWVQKRANGNKGRHHGKGREYTTQAEFQEWVRRKYPDFQGSLPDEAYYWPKDEIEFFVNNGDPQQFSAKSLELARSQQQQQQHQHQHQQYQQQQQQYQQQFQQQPQYQQHHLQFHSHVQPEMQAYHFHPQLQGQHDPNYPHMAPYAYNEDAGYHQQQYYYPPSQAPQDPYAQQYGNSMYDQSQQGYAMGNYENAYPGQGMYHAGYPPAPPQG